MFCAVECGAVVVAHPDDEVMWAGGLLSRYGDSFTVICCSIPRRDPVRAWKFFAACETFGARALLLPFTESDPSQPLENLGCLDLAPFDCVVTHNSVGEYGHAHHRSLSKFVRARWGGKTWTFGWRPDGRGSHVLHLSESEQTRRMAALRCYDHVAPSDNGKPKWQALLDRYRIDPRIETFDPPVCG